MLFQVERQLVADDALHHGLDLDVAQLALGLAFELRVGQLDADDGRQALAHVVAHQVGVVVLEQLGLVGVVVEDARQRRAEAGEVRAAVDGVDAVGEAEGVIGIAVVILHGRLHDGVVGLLGHVDGLRVDDRLVAVEAPDEAGDAAFEVVGLLLVVAAVVEGDLQAAVEIGHLADAVGQGVEIVVHARSKISACRPGRW